MTNRLPACRRGPLAPPSLLAGLLALTALLPSPLAAQAAVPTTSSFVEVPEGKLCALYLEAASSPEEVQWFDTDHGFKSEEARARRGEWLGKVLGLR